MKKILIGGALSLISSLALANNQLVIQQGVPTPLNSNEVRTTTQQQDKALVVKKYKNEAELNNSLMIEYSGQEGKFANDIKEDLKGFGIGFSSSPHRNGIWTKFEYQKNREYDGNAYELSFGGHLNFLNFNGLYAIGTLGTGVSVLDVDGFDTSTYLSIPLGLEVGYTFTPNLSLYGGVGYKWSFNITGDKTLCNDGTTSSSTGSGTCSGHGGIDHYYDANYIGDYDGMTYRTGLRYNF